MPAFERELLSSLNLRKAVGELAGRRVHFNQTDPKRRWAVARQLGLRGGQAPVAHPRDA